VYCTAGTLDLPQKARERCENKLSFNLNATMQGGNFHSSMKEMRERETAQRIKGFPNRFVATGDQ
jgi:hypothetical protein